MISVNGWQILTAFSLLFVILLVSSKHRDDAHVVWQAHEHEDAKHGDLFSWRDCTGRAPSGIELKRAYRRLALQAHPDAGGDDQQFRALQDAQKQLQSPVQYNLRAAFHKGGSVGNHDIHDVRLSLRKTENGPHVKLEIDFSSSATRGFWKFGLLAKEVSSIEYKGDEHGYDMCCNFLDRSNCTYKPYSELVAQHSAHSDTSWDALYTHHDCPLERNRVYTGVVDKPLHVSADGQWAAVVEMMDSQDSEIACAAVTFRTQGEELQPLMPVLGDQL